MNHVWQPDRVAQEPREGPGEDQSHGPLNLPQPRLVCSILCRSADLELHLGLSHTRRSLLGPWVSSNPGARGTFSHHQVQSPPFQDGETEAQRREAICPKSHRKLVTDNGLKLTALPGFLLLFSSIPSLPPALPSHGPPANLSQGPLPASPVPWALSSPPWNLRP